MYYLFWLYVLWIYLYVGPSLSDAGPHCVHISGKTVFSANGFGVILCEVQMADTIHTATRTKYIG